MSNSYQNTINAAAATNLALKEKQLDNQKKTYKKEDLKILQQKYPNSMNIPNPTQKLLYLQQQLQQQRIQQQQQLQQQQLQQQQIMYNKIQNKRKIDREKMLDTYIYDYCIKRDYKQTAELLKQEAKISAEDIQQINSEGFLYEWWTVFWEIYSAKENNEEDTTPDALTYVGVQNLKAKQNELLLRHINSMNTQKGVNPNSLTSQLLNPQLKQLQQLQLQQLHTKQNAQSSNLPQTTTSTTQSSTVAQSAVQQQLQQLQAQTKPNQTQNQSHSNSSSSIITSNQNHSANLNNSNSILPLAVASNSASGAAKNPQLSTSDSPQFNINTALTGLTYTSQSLPNSSRTPLMQTNSIVSQPQQPTQSPHLSTNPSPQLSQGILRNGTNASSIANASNLQSIGRNNATAALYAAMRNQSNLSLQDKNQLLSQQHIMKMVQNKVLNQMKQQKNGLNQTINTSTANASTNIASQINTSGINSTTVLKKSALSPTDSSQEMSPPPSKRIRANGVQYSPVLTNNTIQSPVLTTQQQQTLNINSSPVISNNGLLNDLSTTQLMSKNWAATNKQLINQQLQNSQNQLLLKRQQQLQQQKQLGLQTTEAQELLLQQKTLQVQAQGLKTTNAQFQYNLKLQAQQSQNQILATNTTNMAATSTTTTNFQSIKTTKHNLPQKNKVTPSVTTVPTTINNVDANSITVKPSPSSTSSDLKRKSSISSNKDNSPPSLMNINANAINNQNFMTIDNKSKTQESKNGSTTSQSLTQTTASIDKKDPNNLNQLQLSSLLQNPSNETIDQILQNTSINYSMNEADIFNKSMEVLLNYPSFDGEPPLEKTNSNALFDSLSTFANSKTANVDEDPEKMFTIPVESVFYGTGSTGVDLTTDKQNNEKKSNLNYIGNKSFDTNKLKVLTPITSLQEHKQKISACCFDSMGLTLASGSNDNKTIIWNINNTNGKPRPIWTLGGHKKSVNVVRYCNLTGLVGNAVSAANAETIINSIPTLLVTGSIDKTVRIWKLNGIKNGTINEKEPYEMVTVFENHNWNITAADFCPVAVCSNQNVDGFGEAGKKVMVYCGSLDAEGELKIWNVVSKKILKSVKLNKSSKFDYLSNPLRFRPINNGTFFISDSTIITLVAAYATSLIVIDFILPQQGNLNVDGTDEYTIRTRQTDHKKYISTLEWSNDGNYLITASEDMIYVWNIDSNNEFQVIYSIPSDNGKITSCIFLPEPFIPSINPLKRICIVYSDYDNIYIWESEKNGNNLYSQYSPAVGKINSYNKAHTGTICSLSSCIRLKPTVKTITENTTIGDFEIILASSSSTKDNNLKLWNVNL